MLWYVWSAAKRGCPPQLTASVPRETGRFNDFGDAKMATGKGDNRQNDDENKMKVEKGGKKPDNKAADKKR
jgi:hypothetical protein